MNSVKYVFIFLEVYSDEYSSIIKLPTNSGKKIRDIYITCDCISFKGSINEIHFW